MVPLDSLGQDNQNEVQNGFSGHVTLLAPVVVLNNADGNIRSTITFLRLRYSNEV